MTTSLITSAVADSNEGCLYRAIAVLTRLYVTGAGEDPSSYRAWLGVTIWGATAEYAQDFALQAPARTTTILLDPHDAVGSRVFSCFRFRPESPATFVCHDQPVGPVIVVPCVEFYARRVLHWALPAIEQRMTAPRGRRRSLVVVFAASGATIFDAPATPMHDENGEIDMHCDFQCVEGLSE